MPATLTTAKLAHLIKAMLCNKCTHDIATGVDVIYDDNGTDVLATLTPATVGGVTTRTCVLGTIPDAADVDADLDLAASFLVNKLEHTIATGVVEIMDDAGTAVQRTLTPTEATGVVTVAPS